MKILQLGKFYPIRGGVEKVMRDLTEGISERGVQCDMLCAMLRSDPLDPEDERRSNRFDQAVLIRLNDCGNIICLYAKSKIAGTMIAPQMIRYLKKKKDDYDIIHIHHPDPMAALALRLSGFQGRVVVHWHSDIVSQKLLYFFYRPLQNWMLRRAEKIVGTTPVYVQNSSHLKHFLEKCTYVPIGIHPIPQNEAEIQELRRSFLAKEVILSVGRLVPYKGYEYLIDAMSYLPDSYELHIVGDGPLRKRLQGQIRERNLEHRVTLAGYVPTGEAFYNLFGASDVFVLPSVMKTEAFGIVQIEAMSCGKPVVATTIPGSGVSWVNRNGVSGLNVPPADSKALAEAIRSVCENKVRYGTQARQLFQERYTYKAMIDKVLAIYEKKDA